MGARKKRTPGTISRGRIRKNAEATREALDLLAEHWTGWNRELADMLGCRRGSQRVTKTAIRKVIEDRDRLLAACQRCLNQYDSVHFSINHGETPRVIRDAISKSKGGD